MPKKEIGIALDRCTVLEAAVTAACESLRAAGRPETADSLETRTREAWRPVLEWLARELDAVRDSEGE